MKNKNFDTFVQKKLNDYKKNGIYRGGIIINDKSLNEFLEWQTKNDKVK